MPNWENGIRQSSRKHHGNCKGYFGTAPYVQFSDWLFLCAFVRNNQSLAQRRKGHEGYFSYRRKPQPTFPGMEKRPLTFDERIKVMRTR